MTILAPSFVESDSVVIRNTWRGYVEMLKARGDRSGPLYTFVDGRLTIVSPGLNHEAAKTRLGSMLQEVFKAMRIRFLSAGSVTLWGGAEVGLEDRKGSEPDLCYYLRDLTALAGRRRLERGAEAPRLVMGVDPPPPPHLAVEVAVSHDPTDQLAVLHHFRVPEVWVFRAGGVEFLRWAPPPADWTRLDWSEAVPCLSAAEVTQWLEDPEDDDGAFLHRFDAWVDAVVRPRLAT